MAALRLPTVEGLLRSKRLRWVGHCLRRDETDKSRQAVIRELEIHPSGPWSRLVLGDLAALGWELQGLADRAGQRGESIYALTLSTG